MVDAHKNFATSLVATAPSPATSGTSLVVTTGEGTKFPTAPFNATICPAATAPTTANAEIVRVTAVSTDTLTITRAQEGTSARTVIVGDQIFASITSKTLADAEAAPALSLTETYLRPSGITYQTYSRTSQVNSTVAMTSGTLMMAAIALPKAAVISNISFAGVGAAGTPTHWWFGLYDSSRLQLAVTADLTSTAWAATTTKTVNIATIASGASSTFTTTYEGLYYIGMLMTATTPTTLIGSQMGAAVGALTPLLAGASSTGLTTPPGFPTTAAAITTNNFVVYAGVA